MARQMAHEILISPDHRLRVVFLSVERSPGVWSRSPRIIEQASGLILIDLWGSEWDAELEWQGGKVRLELHRRRRSEWCALVLDIETRTFELHDINGPVDQAHDPEMLRLPVTRNER